MSLLALLLACKGPGTTSATPPATAPATAPATVATALDADGDGWTVADGDCDDSDAAVHPAAEERCDLHSTDEDCNGVSDDDDPDVATSSLNTFFPDADGDGFGGSSTVMACAQPAGTTPTTGDCDDTDDHVHPAAVEDCEDPRDLDCDGDAGYADGDGDGWPACVDCADADPDIHPGADEECDALDVDENCDGLADDADPSVLESSLSTFFLDADGDGFGVHDAEVLACDANGGRVLDATDCDDQNAAIHPGAVEVCDALDRDEDCDGSADDLDPDVDPSTLRVWYPDLDLDGYGGESAGFMACDAPGAVSNAEDCDDTDSAVHPVAVESCSDPRDLNCDGDSEFLDHDLDGWAACEDCDDDNPAIRPDADESCDPDDRDENCDGLSDDADPHVLGVTQTTFYVDHDLDGFGGAESVRACDLAPGRAIDSTDCEDLDPSVNPDAVEVCDPLDADEDCDGLIDDQDGSVDPATFVTGYLDGDGDGAGDASMEVRACDLPTNAVASSEDCDDADAEAHPLAAEDCTDPRDLDCDGDSAYVDADSDAWSACVDCDDLDHTVNPGEVEVCDAANRDEDCSGAADDADPSVDATTRTDFYEDHDRDGFGVGTPSAACDPPLLSAPVAGDCDDGAPRTYPGAPEFCDGEQNDCSAAWTQDVGVASYVTNDGLSWTDYTDLMTGEPGHTSLVSLAEDGALRVCPGVWYASLFIQAQDVIILGTGSSEVYLDGGQHRRSIHASGLGGRFTRIEGVTIQNGVGATVGSTVGGGLSYSDLGAHLELVDVVFDGNASILGYGAVSTHVDTLLLEDVEISNSDGTLLFGAGQFRAQTSIEFDGLVVRNNVTDSLTGGLGLLAPVILGNDLIVEGNVAQARAGGLQVSGDSTFTNVVVTGNASARGAGLDFTSGDHVIVALVATGNVSSGNGGAINIEDGNLTVHSGDFGSNIAEDGAAVYVGAGGTAQLTDCTLGGDDVATSSNVYTPSGTVSLTCDEVSCQ